ncbi:hypothetical protein FA10DRAFT_201402 [Acaromyces ingoldii]|uniref:Uncharacterized protein n=1 Tax=Acaromyces ingoldii TaxID=215250 RepID=A0A316YC96_9BASI|nr:hypothetical protein FA10DRAFT_201402 [Acaromyces ingoldii]PWN86859.1 hypothetical protein FA10DRAFT_201402 [Acaromyces ingoldii]
MEHKGGRPQSPRPSLPSVARRAGPGSEQPTSNTAVARKYPAAISPTLVLCLRATVEKEKDSPPSISPCLKPSSILSLPWPVVHPLGLPLGDRLRQEWVVGSDPQECIAKTSSVLGRLPRPPSTVTPDTSNDWLLRPSSSVDIGHCSLRGHPRWQTRPRPSTTTAKQRHWNSAARMYCIRLLTVVGVGLCSLR